MELPLKLIKEFKRKEARRLAKEGWTVRQIAKKLEISIGTVSGYINKKGRKFKRLGKHAGT